MKITIRNESVTIEGYVNAVERSSKPLTERGVTFIERIAAGAFKRAIERAKDIRILLNHNQARDLGGISDGTLELEEDNIGLHAEATITDPEVIREAKRGDLVGWSFGFADRDVSQLRDEETGLPLRKVNDLDLFEVSILDRKKSPAYVGTLVNVRDDGEEERINISESVIEGEVEIIDTTIDNLEDDIETRGEEPETEKPEATPEPEATQKEISSDYYARYKNIIAEMKSVKN